MNKYKPRDVVYNKVLDELCIIKYDGSLGTWNIRSKEDPFKDINATSVLYFVQVINEKNYGPRLMLEEDLSFITEGGVV